MITVQLEQISDDRWRWLVTAADAPRLEGSDTADDPVSALRQAADWVESNT